MTIEYLQKQGIRSMPEQGVNTITVPGTVDGWQKLADKFGRKNLNEDLVAAIQTAKAGCHVNELVAVGLVAKTDILACMTMSGTCYFSSYSTTEMHDHIL